MKKKLKLSLMALLCPMASLFAQMQIPPGGLQIGDKLPEEVWNLPLQVVNHPEGKETITLDDYKGKLIILDFWATTCSGCIAKMPGLDALQKEFGDRIKILPVSYENKQRVSAFMRSNAKLKELELLSVVDDSLLEKAFPHSLLPHVAWIDGKGNLLATTQAWHVNAGSINKVLSGEKNVLPQKSDLLAYDKKKPLFLNGNGGNGDNMLYRSLLTARLNGVPDSYGISRLADGSIWAHSVNNSIVELYKLAYPDFGKWYRKSRIRLEVPDRETFHFNPYFQHPTPQERESLKTNLYCYELIVPARDSADIRNHIRQDLNRYFGIEAGVEKKWAKCFVLVRTGGKVGMGDTKGKSKVSLTGTTKLRNENMSTLVWCLENIPGTLPVVDETGWETPLNMDINLTKDLAYLREQLRRNGLDIKTAEREVELFVVAINEQNQTGGTVWDHN